MSAPGVAKRDGGPIEKITGVQGVAESVDPPNNNGYERTLKWTNINQAVAALTAVRRQGRSREGGLQHQASRIEFHPFTPHLPNQLGAFHGFGG